MAIDPQYLAALEKLYRTKRVALLDDLREALHTESRTTIFRVLSAVGYRTSYSHAGRYYTLKRIPKFDSHGIWLHRGIGFSLYGTLRATVIHLVEISPGWNTARNRDPPRRDIAGRPDPQRASGFAAVACARYASSSHPGSRADQKAIPGRLPLPQLQTKAGFRAMGPAATTRCGRCPGGVGAVSGHRCFDRCGPSPLG